MRRMDRYKDEQTQTEKRSEKNRDLYQNTNKYTNITDVTNANVYEINSERKEGRTSRENYHQLKKYQNVEEVPKVKKDLEDFKYLYQRNEKKVYDINSVIENARKNKKEKDDLEEKRKLKHTSYNVLSGVNLEELLKYREEKKNRAVTEEEKEIRELVDTIASKTLAGEIDKATSVDLLSDLMATNMLDKVEAPEKMGDDNQEKEEEKSDQEPEQVKEEISDNLEEITLSDQIKQIDEEMTIGIKDKKIDTDFYTRSMDLSEEDFDMDNEFVDKKLPFVVKLLIFILITAVIAVAAYFIHQKM